MGVRATLMILARPLAGPAWAIAAELAWHLAGPAWAFTVLAAGLAWLAGRLPATMAAASAKAYAVETRVNGLVPVVASAQTTANTANSRVSNLSGRNTTTSGLTDGGINGSSGSNGLADGGINGSSSGAGLPDGSINGSSGQINTGGGTAHTHGPGGYAVANGFHSHGNGNYSVANGNHSHGAGGYAVGNGNHAHTLPNALHRKKAGRGVLDRAALGAHMAGSERYRPHRDRHRPGPVPGICEFSQRYPPGYRPGAHGPQRGIPRTGPPVRELWARWAFLAAIAAVWVVAIWVLLTGGGR